MANCYGGEKIQNITQTLGHSPGLGPPVLWRLMTVSSPGD